ncbi:hypothetical protein DY000_02029690 [Brassica cretica]|uniref:Secreted protein n=1 Tax=Brassica cretica TaxID=69181 RepID=A0ABQ7DES0_BRACR|nr:hypothetical protein DY000_02029690 [Brassica cretica]
MLAFYCFPSFGPHVLRALLFLAGGSLQPDLLHYSLPPAVANKLERDLKTWSSMASTKVQWIMIQLITSWIGRSRRHGSGDPDVMDRVIPGRERVFPNTWNGRSATWSGRPLQHGAGAPC